MLKLNGYVALICAIFFSVAMHAQSSSDQQPKAQSQTETGGQASSQIESGAREQRKSQAQSGASNPSQSQSQSGQQQQSGKDVSPSAQAATEPVTTTVRGCVQAGERITLTDSAGNTFLLRGDTSALKGEQHKVVEVSGQQFPPQSRESAAAIPSIDVKATHRIADTCPVNIYQRPRQTSGAGKASPPNPATAPYSGPREGPQGEQSGPPDAVINTNGTGGAPSPGTGNPPPPPQSPPQ
jgi:hypothetical protein